MKKKLLHKEKLMAMKKNIKNKSKYLMSLLVLGSMITSCTEDPNSPGVEYMPDMYRSPAIEVYVDYTNSEVQSARLPVAGTIPFSVDPTKAQFNMPYAYANTSEGYEAAGANLLSPIETAKRSIEAGAVLYTKFCMHCHGETGQGDGGVVTNGGFPPPPAYNGAALKNLPEGKMFHSITYGKGQMGSHSSQLSKEDRWKIVQYVKVLQNDGVSPFDEVEEVNS
jgi:mono/diheme cytochrome c family protein